MRRRRRLAIIGEVVAAVSAVVTAAYLGWACATPVRFARLAHDMVPGLTATFTTGEWLAGAITILLLYALFAWIAWEAAALFRLLRGTEHFGAAIERQLRRLACAVLTGALAGVPGKVALSLALSWTNPPHHRLVVVDVSTSDIGALLMAILLMLFVRIVAEGRRIDEDNQGFV